MNVYSSSFISIGATGAKIATSASSANVAVPVAADGNLPRFIRVAATAAACVKLGAAGVTATTNDLQVQPGDAVIVAVGNQPYIAAIQVSTGGQVQISPLETI